MPSADPRSAWNDVLAQRQHRFRGPGTAALHLLIIAGCPSYTAVHRRGSGLPCCRCPRLEQSASTRHVRTLCVCFPRTLVGFSLQAFLAIARYLNFYTVCAFVIFGRSNRSFYLLTYCALDDGKRAHFTVSYNIHIYELMMRSISLVLNSFIAYCAARHEIR